ncbi:MAG TPA: nicotinamide-nucleotide adenylyltransferase [Thermoplasmata archaeon]|nr:nicotinamide-nucleotide adenylyltransferase [Thermoplasmata archaeon]
MFVGRFQPFHLGHLDMVKRIVAKHAEILIGIGSAQYSHTRENPFTAGERYEMIRRTLDAEKIPRYHIVPIPDTHVHSVWVGHVASLVPKFDVVYTNSPLVVRLFREKGFQVEELPLYKREAYSGTQIRKLIYEGGDWMTYLPKDVGQYILEIDGPQRIRETFRYSTPYGTREDA